MTSYELGDKCNKINDCINALVILTSRSEHHGLDNNLLKEEIQELIRAYHDTIREFEAECVKRGMDEIASVVNAREPVFTKPLPIS